eukprot:1747021-Pyramimonas_sp.AAC.1
MEDAMTTGNNIHVLYVDFADAFGSVDHHRLHAIMEAMGLPRDAIELVRDLYKGASIRVRTPKGDTTSIPIMGRGTIQGHSESAALRNLYRPATTMAGGRKQGIQVQDQRREARADGTCRRPGHRLEMNVDEAIWNKTAWTGIVRDADAGEKAEMDRAKSNGVRIGRGEDEWMGRK